MTSLDRSTRRRIVLSPAAPAALALLLTLVTAGLAVSPAAAAPQAAKAPPAATTDAAASPLVGLWQGALHVQAIELRLLFHVEPGADGGLTGTLDSIDQGAKGIPLSRVSLEDGRATLASAAVGGVFEGELAADGGHITGYWRQGGNELPLELERVAAEPVLERPQQPTGPLPYAEEEVTLPGGAEDVTLAGTLTLPAGDGPHPAVLLISGSGPQNRDEALMGHQPFRVLADHLTRRGIAVLRLDDRGVGASSGDFTTATTADFADDAEAAFGWLRRRPETDAARVGLLGHSEGGLVAPMVAAREPAVAFLVLLAAPGVPGEEILYRQAELIARAAGATDEAVRENRVLQERVFAAATGSADPEQAAAQVRRVVAEALQSMSEEERQAAGLGEDAAAAQAKQVVAPWFRFFLSHDPRPVLRRVGCPVLALWGAKDLQVPPQQSRPELEAALAAGGNQRVTAEVLPGLNHLFQTADSGLPAEYGQIEETMAPAALERISGWILALPAAASN